jgi:hypothetical protein
VTPSVGSSIDPATRGFSGKGSTTTFGLRGPTSAVPRLKCYSLLLGARNTPGAGKHFTKADNERIHAITFRHFPDGFSILNAEGGWFDPNRRKFVEEDSRQILVCARSVRQLRGWCEDLTVALKQKELLVVELGPAFTFRAARRQLRPKKT